MKVKAARVPISDASPPEREAREKTQIAAAAHAINDDMTIILSSLTNTMAREAAGRIVATTKRMLAYAASMDVRGI